MKAYSIDLRERVVRAVDGGLPKAVAARTLAVSVSPIGTSLRQRRATGSLAPRPIPGRPADIPPAQRDAFVAMRRAAPDATLAERVATWAHDHHVAVHPATTARA